jgi:hypothetical protein
MSQSPDTPLPLRMRQHELAQYWNTSVRTLQRWRRLGAGPTYLRVGRSVLYRIEDIRAFELAARRNGGAT